MSNQKVVNAVTNLAQLYTVIIAAALSLAVKNLIGHENGLQSISLDLLFLFGAFLITLLPFYHGAIRHLYDAYIDDSVSTINYTTLIFDIIPLILHAILFSVLSQLLTFPFQFVLVLIAILAIDMIWGVFVHHALSKKSDAAEWKWTCINTVYVLAMGIFLFASTIDFTVTAGATKLSAIVFLSATLRTVVDYIWAKDFYFPE